ncbi:MULTISPECIES: hypothetical protein [unclassified Actinobaculum]|uniref:hypothetical protein n=1 Tax=unclassified Actinobaculum TaxID=2609299 RepID=UPI000D52A243|nr:MULTISPECIES: hypothetical protein [unclassified Actinobaculum]AWE42862.1 hypothetical protein DDD63_09030 [Actinobaculum sp. 313]RTE49058.1 hypothetical protein EKN07_07995 [Actinobaculum sp. 352]
MISAPTSRPRVEAAELPVMVVPRRLVIDEGLSYAALGVYLVIASVVEGVSPDGHELVGRGLSQDEIIAAIEELRDRGLVQRRQS